MPDFFCLRTTKFSHITNRIKPANHTRQQCPLPALGPNSFACARSFYARRVDVCPFMDPGYSSIHVLEPREVRSRARATDEIGAMRARGSWHSSKLCAHADEFGPRVHLILFLPWYQLPPHLRRPRSLESQDVTLLEQKYSMGL